MVWQKCSGIRRSYLGHAMPGVMGIYNRSQYLPDKLDALNRWLDRLDELAKKHPFIPTGNKKSG